MVQLVSAQNLDEEAWNRCARRHGHGRPYHYTWFLDTVCPHWDALVVGNYEAIMPLPRYQKLGVEWSVSPPWTGSLGFIGPQDQIPKESEWKPLLPNPLKYIDLLLSPSDEGAERLYQWHCGPETLALRADADISRQAEQYTVFHNDPPEALIGLLKEHRLARHPFEAMDEERLKHLMHVGIHKRKGQVWSLYDRSNTLVAGAYIFYDAEAITVHTLAQSSPSEVSTARLLLWAILKESEPYPVRVEVREQMADPSVVQGLYPEVKFIPNFTLNRLPWYLKWYRPEV